jgi:hypothetical protein
MRQRKVAGTIHVDSALILILDPGRLAEWQYDSVIDEIQSGDTAEIWLDEEPKAEEILGAVPRRTNDGVVVSTGSDGSFDVQVEYGPHGRPVSIHIDLDNARQSFRKALS